MHGIDAGLLCGMAASTHALWSGVAACSQSVVISSSIRSVRPWSPRRRTPPVRRAQAPGNVGDPLIALHPLYLAVGSTLEATTAYRDWLELGGVHQELADIRRCIVQRHAAGDLRFQVMVEKTLDRTTFHTRGRRPSPRGAQMPPPPVRSLVSRSACHERSFSVNTVRSREGRGRNGPGRNTTSI